MAMMGANGNQDSSEDEELHIWLEREDRARLIAGAECMDRALTTAAAAEMEAARLDGELVTEEQLRLEIATNALGMEQAHNVYQRLTTVEAEAKGARRRQEQLQLQKQEESRARENEVDEPQHQSEPEIELGREMEREIEPQVSQSEPELQPQLQPEPEPQPEPHSKPQPKPKPDMTGNGRTVQVGEPEATEAVALVAMHVRPATTVKCESRRTGTRPTSDRRQPPSPRSEWLGPIEIRAAERRDAQRLAKSWLRDESQARWNHRHQLERQRWLQRCASLAVLNDTPWLDATRSRLASTVSLPLSQGRRKQLASLTRPATGRKDARAAKELLEL